MKYVKDVLCVGNIKTVSVGIAIAIEFRRCEDYGITVDIKNYIHRCLIISRNLFVGVSLNRLLIANKIDLYHTKYSNKTGFIVIDIYKFLKLIYKTHKIIDLEVAVRRGHTEKFFIGENIICTTDLENSYINPHTKYINTINPCSGLWKFIYETCERYVVWEKSMGFFKFWCNRVEYEIRPEQFKKRLYKSKYKSDIHISFKQSFLMEFMFHLPFF